MKRKDLLTKLLLLCVMIVGSVNAAWADQTYHTITPNNDSEDYETYGIYKLFSNKTTVNAAYSAWVSGAVRALTGESYTEPTGWLDADRATYPGYGSVSVRTETVTFYVTNCIEVAMVSKSGGTTRSCQLSVKDASNNTEVGTIAIQSANSIEATTYGTALDASKNYIVTLSGTNSSNNQYFYQIRFKAPQQTGVTKPTFDKAANASLVKGSGTVTLESEGNTVYYKWSTSSSAYTDDQGATLASAADGSGTSPVNATAPSTPGTWYLYAVAYDGTSEYSDVVSRSYTITNQTYTVSKGSTSNGTILVSSASAEEGAEVTLTAYPSTGYELASWTIIKDDDESDVTASVLEGNTLTMPAYDVTVNATFALVDYTITHNTVEHGSYTVQVASADAVSTNTTANYNQTITLAATPDEGYVFVAWNVTKTSGGASVTMATDNTFVMPAAAVTITPTFSLPYTLSYDSNGGTGSMEDTEGAGSITLTANAFTKTGYTFVGWATSQANADAGTVTYADKASYSLTANATLYAVWGENYYEFTPTEISGSLSSGNVVKTSSGGKMTYTPGGSGSPTLQYTSDGLKFGASSSAIITIELNDYLKEGSVITATFWSNSTTANRGADVLNAAGEDKADWYFTGTSEGVTKVFSLVATSTNGFANTKVFKLKRKGDFYLKSLTVTDCQPGGIITDAGWSTYSSNKRLDLLSIRGGTAYIATRISDGVDCVIVKPCTDIVAAEEGLMIKGTPGATFTIDKTDEAVTFAGTNLMKGLPNGGTVSYGAGNYVFGWPSKSESPDEDCGFYYVNTNAVTLPNGRAYLTTGDVGSARLSIVFDDEIATGVADVRSKMEDIRGEYFDLQGRRISQPTKGLYIVNGKKVVVK